VESRAPAEAPPAPDGPLPTFADVAAAAEALPGLVDRTPAPVSRTLSELAGCTIVLKLENLQFTGSFKDRGAAYRLLQLGPEERRRGVIAASAGNHALGVAHHAARLGCPAVIVVPVSAPLAKVANAMRLGARVIQHGSALSEAVELVNRLAAEEGLTIVHPYDDRFVIAGQGTVGLELFDDHPDLDDLVVPVGGGGLLGGISLVAAERAPGCRLVGVQSERYPALVERLRALGQAPADGPAAPGAPEGSTGTGLAPEAPPPGGSSIADGIAVKRPGRLTVPLLAAAGVEPVTVPEARIEEAVGLLVEVEKTVAEGAGAAALAAVLARPERFAGRKVGVVVSGGNIDLRLLSSVILRALVRQQRLTRLRVECDDLPGNLGRVATLIGEAGGNLVEVAHQRLLGEIPVRRVDLDLLVETLDDRHLQRVLAALHRAGYGVAVVEP
jgi:threonine dehydratase